MMSELRIIEISRLISLVVLLNINYSILYLEATDCMEPFCKCLDSKSLLCNNFSSFQELNFRRLSGRPFEAVQLIPRSNLLLDLDDNLKFNGLVLNGR
jgi:hypothetical protein